MVFEDIVKGRAEFMGCAQKKMRIRNQVHRHVLGSKTENEIEG
jgi:hypothetical protein